MSNRSPVVKSPPNTNRLAKKLAKMAKLSAEIGYPKEIVDLNVASSPGLYGLLSIEYDAAFITIRSLFLKRLSVYVMILPE